MTKSIVQFFRRSPRLSSEEREYRQSKIELANEQLRLQDARLDAQAREEEIVRERRISTLHLIGGKRASDA